MSKCPFANGNKMPSPTAAETQVEVEQDNGEVASNNEASETNNSGSLVEQNSTLPSNTLSNSLEDQQNEQNELEESEDQQDQMMELGVEESDADSAEDSDDDDEDDDYDYVDDMLENFTLDAASTSKPQATGKKRRRLSGGEEGEENEGENGEGGDLLERKRMVLIKRDQDHFEILPEGWVEITHFSGMPIYLHKASRVCTLSKPYLLGAGSARKHDVPISSIPCLQYRKEVEREKEREKEQQQKIEEMDFGVNGNGTTTIDNIAGIAKVETLAANKKEKSVDYSLLREYCQKLFEFKQVTIRKFRTWADRRKHAQTKKLSQRPSLPESTKLITCTVPKSVAGGSPGKANKKEFIMNPAGKSVVCILHEFVQHTGRTQPKYKFQELENVAKPYSATVIINEMQYGIGYGSSKKEAKTEAARASLRILIPDFQNPTEGEGTSGGTTASDSNDLSFFDNIRIEDPRVSELCLKAGQYSPYQILVECLRRHYGVNDLNIETEVRLLKHQKNEYKMKVGEHEASVICKNKREGKQRAAQSILQKLHANLNSWGALLKLYGRGSCKTPKEKREEAQQITELQSMACSNQPNYKILEKLREEMLKLRERPALNLTTPINSIQMAMMEPSTSTNSNSEEVSQTSNIYSGISSLTSTLTLPS